MSLSVLFVDDEPRMLASLHRAMARSSLDLFTALSGRLALDLMGERRIDVLVADYRMPGMDGATLLGRVRRTWPGVQRILWTGHGLSGTALGEAAPHIKLDKPCGPQKLRDALRMAALAVRQRRCRPAVAQDVLRQLEAAHPGIGAVPRDGRGAVVLDL